jgi:hypothetical protein
MTKDFKKPLRDWACPSYDPGTGRAASSLGSGEPYSAEGEHINPSRQLPGGQPGKGSPSLKALDAQRTTVSTPVKSRPVG